MTEKEARYSVELLDALAELTDVRQGLKDGDANLLELVALEGTREGGTHHGASYLPEGVWPELLDFTEMLIRRELTRLDVQPAPQPAPDVGKAKE